MAVSFVIASVIGAQAKKSHVSDENSHILAGDGQMTCGMKSRDDRENS